VSLRDEAIEAAQEAEARFFAIQYPCQVLPRRSVVVDAVLAVVADWCDKQDEATRDEHGNFFGTFGWDHSSNEGASAAFDHVARACRPQDGA